MDYSIDYAKFRKLMAEFHINKVGSPQWIKAKDNLWKAIRTYGDERYDVGHANALLGVPNDGVDV